MRNKFGKLFSSFILSRFLRRRVGVRYKHFASLTATFSKFSLIPGAISTQQYFLTSNNASNLSDFVQSHYSKMTSAVPFGNNNESPQNLATFSQEAVKKTFQDIDAVLFDCDGVLWHGNEPVKNSQSLVILLRSLGKNVFFLTNNSTKTREEFIEKFNTLGYQAAEDEIVGTAWLTALYLKELNFKKKVYIVGSKGISEELAKVGIESLEIGPDPVPITSKTWKGEDFENVELDPEVGAVIVGFDHHFSYNKALKAASYLAQDKGDGEKCLFIATNTDEQFPGRGAKKLVFPGTGTFVAAVKTCSGKEPIIMGKPETFAYELLQKKYNFVPERVLMVGDRGNTDILFGRNCAMKTLLVLSGVTSLDELHRWEKSTKPDEQSWIPTYYANDVNEVFHLLSKSQVN